MAGIRVNHTHQEWLLWVRKERLDERVIGLILI